MVKRVDGSRDNQILKVYSNLTMKVVSVKQDIYLKIAGGV
jgi:hypothetical protein